MISSEKWTSWYDQSVLQGNKKYELSKKNFAMRVMRGLLASYMIQDVLVSSAIRARHSRLYIQGIASPHITREGNNKRTNDTNKYDDKILLCHGEVRPKQKRCGVLIKVTGQFFRMGECVEDTTNIDR